jgi:hypothetical protein
MVKLVPEVNRLFDFSPYFLNFVVWVPPIADFLKIVPVEWRSSGDGDEGHAEDDMSFPHGIFNFFLFATWIIMN